MYIYFICTIPPSFRYVGNLPSNVTESKIMELFQRVGPIKHCKVLYPVSSGQHPDSPGQCCVVSSSCAYESCVTSQLSNSHRKTAAFFVKMEQGWGWLHNTLCMKVLSCHMPQLLHAAINQLSGLVRAGESKHCP